MAVEFFLVRRSVGDQAGPGLIARMIIQYDEVALYPPTSVHPTVAEPKSNPDAKHFLLGALLFAGTCVEANRERYEDVWDANKTAQTPHV